MRSRKWIEINNNILSNIIISNSDQSFFMTEVPWNSNVKKGENVKWYDSNWMRIPDTVLVKKGIRIDNRGVYWYVNDYRKTLLIIHFDIEVPKDVTTKEPIPNEPNVWLNGKWEIDEMEKARLKNILSIEDVQSFVSGLVGDQV